MLKKIIVLLLLISTTKIFAQSSFNISTNISISLNNGLALNKVKGDLDFGEIIYTGNRFTLTRSADLGIEFEVTGFSRRNVTVTFSRNVNLNNNDWVDNFGGTKGTIRFTPNVRHTNGNINYVSPRILRNGNTVRLSNDSPLGKLYIWIGGSMTINRNQPYGDYKGTFILTVEY